MAKNLLKAGYSLTVYNRSAKALRWFQDQGIRVVETPAKGAEDADAIITMLADDDAVSQVLGDEETGCIRSVKAGALVIDSSTISPSLSRSLSTRFMVKGVVMLDAPVTGSAPQAQDGTLTFIVGGKEDAYHQAEPLFRAMGRRAVYIGPSGSGSTVKLANNIMGAINMMAVAEGLSIVQKSGLDAEKFFDVIAGGGANNGMVISKREKVLNRRYTPDFTARLMLKDLRLASHLAWNLDIPLPGLALISNLYQIACHTGASESDMSALLETYEKLSGTTQTPEG